ncbi:flavin-containing monooxygenase [Rugosimonospora africana]|uniref:Baeyer-Villiger monooxygenase n=1 Tax=Rugosimonospora africana TaxID=556532 RepID=A0A8J3QVD1_9ACTN|nr:NAD(P)/FAD-dependent oxidoreductase [Rugosimonospora africana]GIH16505.1 Baeyer-Villiger monooxygenase [Rugosimonospora africana]
MRVAIIGAGFGGLGAAIRLKHRGINDFVILERAGDVGGTWRDNTYPGCACDVPSHLYSYSFEPNPYWPQSYSGQSDIWAYLRGCVDRYGIEPHLRRHHEVREAAWDEQHGRWVVDTTGGTLTADVLVSAAGPLADPSVPDLPGLDSFAGTTFHSARWRHDHDLTGRRVAVIGTGASAIQFVPQIASGVDRLELFQRTPPWILPRANRRISALEHRLFRAAPPVQRLFRTGVYLTLESTAVGFLHPSVMRIAQRMAERNLRRTIADPALRARLTPTYRMGCKRILLSDTYLPTLNRDNVNVVTDPITEIRTDGVVTRTGDDSTALHGVDTIIFATGFHTSDTPIAERIRGRDGTSLAEVWQGSPRAYLGTTVAGFPNLFLLLGPNTGLGHSSVVFMMEGQLDYLMSALDYLRANGITAVEPTARAQEEFVTAVDRKMAGTVWGRGGCHSWYQDATGRNAAIWPGSTWRYRQRVRRFDPGAYRTVAAKVPA